MRYLDLAVSVAKRIGADGAFPYKFGGDPRQYTYRIYAARSGSHYFLDLTEEELLSTDALLCVAKANWKPLNPAETISLDTVLQER